MLVTTGSILVGTMEIYIWKSKLGEGVRKALYDPPSLEDQLLELLYLGSKVLSF